MDAADVEAAVPAAAVAAPAGAGALPLALTLDLDDLGLTDTFDVAEATPDGRALLVTRAG